MGKSRAHNLIKTIGFIILAIITLIAVDGFLNKRNVELSSLSEYDQKALREVNIVFEKEGEKSFWQDFNLSEKAILLINDDSNYSYLVNPKTKVNSFFAAPIKTSNNAEDIGLKIYRISRTYPGLLRIRLFGGKFNTIGEISRIMGNDVYYLKFGPDDFTKENSSNYPVNLLYHESFHYFMQNGWSGGDRFLGELSKYDMKLLDEKLNLLDDARAILKKSDLKSGELEKVAQDIIDIEEKRLEANPEYVTQENMMETTEGSASYVGMLASKEVGYDYGPMYFDNKKDVPFSDVVPYYEEGILGEGFLRDRLPYETGLVLTMILHELDKEDSWQVYINGQTLEKQRTLLDALKETVK